MNPDCLTRFQPFFLNDSLQMPATKNEVNFRGFLPRKSPHPFTKFRQKRKPNSDTKNEVTRRIDFLRSYFFFNFVKGCGDLHCQIQLHFSWPTWVVPRGVIPQDHDWYPSKMSFWISVYSARAEGTGPVHAKVNETKAKTKTKTKAKQNKAKQSKTKQRKAKQNKTEQSKTKQMVSAILSEFAGKI